FNEGNLLEKVDVFLLGAQTATAFVTNMDCNARGQSVLIETGNGVQTEYVYDPATFRMTRVRSTRIADHALLQDLAYTYDPMGNVTNVEDAAQQTVYFSNQAAAPNADYTYDALYWLISSAGREHIGQANAPQTTSDDRFRINLP